MLYLVAIRKERDGNVVICFDLDFISPSKAYIIEVVYTRSWRRSLVRPNERSPVRAFGLFLFRSFLQVGFDSFSDHCAHTAKFSFHFVLKREFS